MTLRQFTVEQQIEEVESLLEAFRLTSKARARSHCVEVLKSIRADLLARRPGKPTATLAALNKRIAGVLAAKNPKAYCGYEAGALIGLAIEVIGSWPTIRQALEKT